METIINVLSLLFKGCFVVSAGGVVKCFGIMCVAFMEDFNSKAGNAAWIIVLCNSILFVGVKHFAGHYLLLIVKNKYLDM